MNRLSLIIFTLGCAFISAKLLGQTHTIDRPGFTMQYPASWKIATHQNDYDPDRLFTIDTEGQSTITIELFESIAGRDTDDMLFNAMTVLDGPLVDTYSRSDLDNWGPHRGSGKHMKGKVMGMFPGGAIVFFTEENGKGVMITQIYFSEDLPDAMPGFELISNTFRLK